MANRYWVGGTATWDATAGTKWALTSGGAGGQAVPTTSDTVFFDANSGANTVTIGSGVATCSTLTMTGFTGTLAFGSNSITCAGTGTIYTGATTFSVTGTPLIICNNSSATARTIAPAATTEANSISFNITAGTGSVSLTAGSYLSLNFTGFTGTLANSAITIYGSITLNSGMTFTDGTGVKTFASTLVQQNITSNGVTFGGLITCSGTQTVQLQDALTLASARTVTLTSGTLDLNSKTLTCGFFSSTLSATRSIAFGTGNITLTGNNGTVLGMGTATGFTYTGTPTINATYSGSTGTRTFAFGGAGATATNCPSVYITAGSDILGFTTSANFLNLVLTGFSGSINGLLINLYGNLTIPAGVTCSQSSASAIAFQSASATQLIDTNNILLNIGCTFLGAGIKQLVSALNIGSANTFTLTSGPLDLTNGGANSGTTLSCGIFSLSGTNTRSIAFGTTGNVTITGNNAGVLSASVPTGFSYTGTPTINLTYSGSVGTRNIAFNSSWTEAQALDLYIIGGSDAVTVNSVGFNVGTLSFSGYTGTFTRASSTLIYRNLVLSTGMTHAAVANNLAFQATVAATQLITSNGVAINSPVIFSGTNTYQLQDAMTVGSIYSTTLTTGAINLNGKTLTTGTFNSSNTNTRSIAFGTGNISLTSNAVTVLLMGTADNFTYTGTPTINATYSGSTGTRTIQFGNTSGSTETNVPSINVTAGSDIVILSTSFKNVDFTGFTGSLTNLSRAIYGNLTISSGMTLTAGANATTFAATSGTQQITTAGKTLSFPITQNSVGGTVQLQDAITFGSTYTLVNGTFDSNNQTISGISVLAANGGNAGFKGTFNIPLQQTTSNVTLYANTTTSTYTLDSGTLNLNGFNLTCSTQFSTNNISTRAINFASFGNIILSGAGTVWDATNITGLTTSGSGGVSFTSASPKTFIGGGGVYRGISQDGTGTLTLTGANTFTTIANTVQPTTVTFPASTITSVNNFTLSGTAGNLVTINSSIPGTQFTLAQI